MPGTCYKNIKQNIGGGNGEKTKGSLQRGGAGGSLENRREILYSVSHKYAGFSFRL